MPSGSSARLERSVSVAWSRLARLMYANSSTSSSNITITRETIRAATTSSCSDRHLRSTRTPTLSGGSASADFSASTTERPHEGAADYLHLTRWRWPSCRASARSSCFVPIAASPCESCPRERSPHEHEIDRTVDPSPGHHGEIGDTNVSGPTSWPSATRRSAASTGLPQLAATTCRTQNKAKKAEHPVKQVVDLFKRLDGFLGRFRMTNAKSVTDLRECHGFLTQQFAKPR